MIAFTLLSGKMSLDGVSNLIPFKQLFVNMSRGNLYFFIQLLVNVFMFVPMGVFMFLSGKDAKKTCLIGLLLSFGIELFEYITGRGVFDIYDLILNTLGTLFGYLLAKLILDPVTAKKLIFSVLLYGLVVIMTTVGLYRVNNYYMDELARRAMIIWTPKAISSVEEYDPEYVFSIDEKCSFIFTGGEDENGYVRLDVDEGKVRIYGEGDSYSWVKSFFKTSEDWVKLETLDSDKPEYRNVYKAGNHMAFFCDENTMMIFPSLNEGAIVRFSRIQE